MNSAMTINVKFTVLIFGFISSHKLRILRVVYMSCWQYCPLSLSDPYHNVYILPVLHLQSSIPLLSFVILCFRQK
jgi:hypothetical protein